MKKKSVVLYKNTPLMLCIGLCFIIPGDTFRALVVLIVALIMGVLHKISFQPKDILGIGMLRWIYVITVVSSYIIHYYSVSFVNIFDFIIVFFLGRYIIVASIKTKKDFESFLNALLFVFFIYAILGLVETFTQFNIFDFISNREIILGGANSFRNGFFRSYGFCTISINNGVIMSMIWCLAAYKLFNKLSIWNLMVYIVIGIYTFLIFSRMVILVALLSQFLLIFSVRKVGKFKAALVVITMITLFYVLPSANTIFNGVINSFLPLIEELQNFSFNTSGINSGGTGERIALWGWVYNTIRDDLYFGVGFSKPFAYYYWFVDRFYLKESIENQWLWTLYRTGVYGLIGFIVYQIYCLKSTLIVHSRKRRSNNKKNALQGEKLSFFTCMRIIVIGFFVCIFSVASFEDLIVFYFLYALYESYINLVSKEGMIYE